jgi:hypothetical protein
MMARPVFNKFPTFILGNSNSKIQQRHCAAHLQHMYALKNSQGKINLVIVTSEVARGFNTGIAIG